MRRAFTGAVIALALACTLASAQETQRRGFAVEITQPANQTVVFGRTKIAAEVRVDDPASIERVEFLVGDDVIFVDREPPYECTHDFGEEAKSFVIQVVAYHVEEVTARDTVVTRRAAFSAVEQVNRIVLWISATDKDKRFVADVKKSDFRVFENDVEQQVLELNREERPIALAIVMDSSGSMRGEKLTALHEAASAFVETLRPDDRALVIDFDERVFLIQDLTADHDLLKEAITSTEAIGGTAIYDAMHAAYRKIGHLDGRKVVILLTDGDDSASQFAYERILEEAKSNGTMVYSIALSGEGGGDASAPKQFSEATGGEFFRVKKASDLAGVYQRIADELRTQFYLVYSTANENWDGRWMKVRVDSTRPGIEIRARRGYYAVRFKE